jgi:hypothetical protein
MTDAEFGRTLGETIKAARMRYGWLSSVGAFMRLSTVADGLFKAEVVPAETVASLGRVGPSDQTYVLWYSPDSKIRAEMNRLCARVLAGEARPKRIKRPIAFLFGDDGEFRGWAP